MNKGWELPEDLKEVLTCSAPVDGQYRPYYFAGARITYSHLSPEIASLKAERDSYRMALEEVCISTGTISKPSTNQLSQDMVGKIAKTALDKYPSL